MLTLAGQLTFRFHWLWRPLLRDWIYLERTSSAAAIPAVVSAPSADPETANVEPACLPSRYNKNCSSAAPLCSQEIKIK